MDSLNMVNEEKVKTEWEARKYKMESLKDEEIYGRSESKTEKELGKLYMEGLLESVFFFQEKAQPMSLKECE